MAQPNPRTGLLQYGLALGFAVLAAGCAGKTDAPTRRGGDAAIETPDTDATSPRPRVAASDSVIPGIEVLLAQNGGPLRGRKVGLITNHTGIGRDGRSSIDLLYEHPAVELVALFSPEHGIRGTAEAGEKVASGRDEKTGLPIHSLYGETRKPTAAMLEGLDALAFDIQDIGTRYYTYVWTMALAMQAAAEQGIEFVVLDRPNPIGGERVQGNILEPEHATFVGLYPVPMRHGLTAGELARFVNGEFDIGAELAVVPARGWRRAAWFDQTGLPWKPPSPNMPSLESAIHYPGTCLFEGTNLSVGRGTPIAFQVIGAPWLDHEAVVDALRRHGLPGVRFEAVTVTPLRPGDGKYDGETVRAVRFATTDRAVYDPTAAAVALLTEVRRIHPDRLEFRDAGFDRLAGTSRLREAVLAGRTAAHIVAGWEAELASFRTLRQPYLLYP